MNQKSIYWLCQIGGWTIFAFSELIGYLFTFNFAEDTVSQMIGIALVNILVGISLTHLFRLNFIDKKWAKLPIAALIFKSAIGVLIITFVLLIINIPLDDFVFNFKNINVFLRNLVYFINLSKPVIIWVLIYVFFALSSERQKEVIEKLNLESSIKESESKILRAQMNPHFIFNALNSIRALIYENPDKASQSINQLSNILRSALVADRKETIPIRDELKTVNDYLALEKVRYEDRLQVIEDIDPRTLDMPIPPMMLQTLVENAVKHGVQKEPNWGFIEIKTSIEGGYLNISIKNSGKLKENEVKERGYGLENTLKRLKLIYGDDVQFTIKQNDELTVISQIKIPLNELKNESINS